ncbi:MAG: hypothetical protein KatS3mg031_2505 [Chitinophagales bacterium]|nr:MAG: hypothetical protein KatS3mg031_2505 [Chitinophagales bacterium]
MNCRFLLLCVFGVLAMQETSAQTTYDRVYGILQSSCAAYCHNSSNPTGNLLLDGSKQQVMNSLVNVVPDNAVAAAKGYLLVFPGDARRSFLVQKDQSWAGCECAFGNR